MKYINKMLFALVCVACFSACQDDGEYEHPIVQDNVPSVPIMFPGSTTAGANPYYTVQFPAGGNPANIAIQIQIGVGAGSPNGITEITKVIAGATGITPGNVLSATGTGLYYATPITVSGGTATINTTLAEYNSKVIASARLTAPPAAGVLTERAFMFLVTLDDNTTVIPQQVRVRFIP